MLKLVRDFVFYIYFFGMYLYQAWVPKQRGACYIFDELNLSAVLPRQLRAITVIWNILKQFTGVSSGVTICFIISLVMRQRTQVITSKDLFGWTHSTQVKMTVTCPNKEIT